MVPDRGLAALAGQHPGQRGLARAVASDQADPVARTDSEGGVLQQDSGADAHFDMGGSDHRTIVRDGGARSLRSFHRTAADVCGCPAFTRILIHPAHEEGSMPVVVPRLHVPFGTDLHPATDTARVATERWAQLRTDGPSGASRTPARDRPRAPGRAGRAVRDPGRPTAERRVGGLAVPVRRRVLRRVGHRLRPGGDNRGHGVAAERAGDRRPVPGTCSAARWPT